LKRNALGLGVQDWESIVQDKKLRILIADDQPYMRRAVKALLESQDGWVVCGEAADGLEAIEKTKELHPDVIVMDMVMPRVNGLEATRKIHQDFPDSQVLILTLHNLPELATLVKSAGARGLVLKSDSNNLLISAVERLGQQQRLD
jgi:DNA-binding NarL/FixJ family response regulator